MKDDIYIKHRAIANVIHYPMGKNMSYGINSPVIS